MLATFGFDVVNLPSGGHKLAFAISAQASLILVKCSFDSIFNGLEHGIIKSRYRRFRVDSKVCI